MKKAMTDRTMDFVPLIETMEGGKLLPLSIRCIAAMHLCDYVVANPHRNLNELNLSINVTTGELRVNTEVEQSDWPADAFVPPETSDWNPNFYVLMVYITLIMTGAHPYKGRKWYEKPLVTDDFIEQYFVKYPEFILATSSQAPNAPQPLTQAHVKTMFNSLSQNIRIMIRSAFTEDGKFPFISSNDIIGVRNKFFISLSQTSTESLPGGNAVIHLPTQREPDLCYNIYEGKMLINPDDLSVLGIGVMTQAGLMLRNETCTVWENDTRKFNFTPNKLPVRVNPGEMLPLTRPIRLFTNEDGVIRFDLNKKLH